MDIAEMQNLIVRLDRAIYYLGEVLELDEPGEGSLMTISNQRDIKSSIHTLLALRSDYQEAFDINLANQQKEERKALESFQGSHPNGST